MPDAECLSSMRRVRAMGIRSVEKKLLDLEVAAEKEDSPA